MKELFNNIISVQFGASIAIAFLLLSRRTMKRHYVAKLRYWLWLIIALRLCLPVDINIQLNRTAPVNIPVRDYYISAQQPQIDGQMTEFEIITADQLNSRPMENTEYTQEIPPVISTVSITDILYRIWLAVAVLLGVVSVISYILAKRDIMSTAFYDDNLTACMENMKKQMKISKQVKIAVCNYTGSPMLVGIFSPVIVLPNNEYTATQLEMIIRHELTHLKRNDILYKFILHLVSCVYWFNPLTACMARLAGKDIEISCDEDIVKTGDKQFKAEYAQTIIRVISMQNNKLILATNFSQNAKTVKERFTNIFTNRKLKAGKSVIAVFMAVVVIATSLVGCSNRTSVFNASPVLDNVSFEKCNNLFVYSTGVGEDVCESSSSRFYYKAKGVSAYGFLLKYIEENGETGIMCNANCSHDTPDCNAVISPGKLFTVNDKVYYLTEPELYKSTDRTQYTQELLEITESGRVVLCEFKGYNFIESNIISVDNCIYFSGKKFNTNESHDEIIKVDLESGKYTTTKLKNDAHIRNISAVSDNGECIIGTTDFFYNNEETEIIAVSVETGDVQLLRTIDFTAISDVEKDTVGRCWLTNDSVFVLDLKNNVLTQQKYGQVKETILIDDIYAAFNAERYVNFIGVYDNKIVFEYFIDSRNTEYKYVYYDLITEEIKELTIMKTSDVGYQLANIMGIIGNNYVICINDVGPSCILSLISKDNYFNNNPQILPLDNAGYIG
ncbi:MAG: M56 family metallopeptidase [Oscillospiraceae bacterium]|nr:M56 family metallopeptidase [Oscillospiraceae bacterium]